MRPLSFKRRLLLFSVPPMLQSAVSFELVMAVTSFGTALSTLGEGSLLAQLWPDTNAEMRRDLVSSLLGLSVVLAGVALTAGAVALVESAALSIGQRAFGFAAVLVVLAVAGRRMPGALRLQLEQGWS